MSYAFYYSLQELIIMMGPITMMGAILVLISVIVVTVEVATKFEAIEEWQLWKAEHGQQYPSSNVS